ESIQTDFYREIGVDIAGDAAAVVFDGFALADDPNFVQLSQHHPLEFVAGWRDADPQVNVDLSLKLPDGSKNAIEDQYFSSEGFEETRIPAGVTLAAGTYQFQFSMDGAGRTANVATACKLLNVEHHFQGLLQGDALRYLGVDVQDGVATILFDGF